MPRPASPKRTKFEHERDLQVTAEMYLCGKTQQQIAEVLCVTQQQISKDVRTLQKRWVESSLRDFDEMRAEQLAKVDRLELEYWEAWERSKRPKPRKGKKEKTGDTNSDEAGVTIEERDGNPTYLGGVERCIERRCKLLGLDAPDRLDIENRVTQFLLPPGVDTKGTEFDGG